MFKFKHCGRIDLSSGRHSLKSELGSGDLIAPRYVHDEWTNKPDIPQYAPTIVGSVRGFAPATDCEGAFMSFKYQSDNNCYAYACCIATNSFPQPGRASHGSADLNKDVSFTPANIQRNAERDGLVPAGTQLPSPGQRGQGHLAALLFSAPVSKIGGDPLANWDGDYHWARCDDAVHYARWSQKDGGGQVTDFDFAGQPITNPALANWTVNNGPVGRPPGAHHTDHNEFKVTYEFVCFMWVPQHGVHII